MFARYLKIDLPPHQSAFLWGARKTGKSTYLKQAFPNALYYDLLKTDIAFALAKAPHLFREEVLEAISGKDNALVVVDEVQKIPALLDEIQWLIENSRAQFILCGSSARKLRKSSVNMLGGRAWRYHFYPLSYIEIPDFDIIKAFDDSCKLSKTYYAEVEKAKNLSNENLDIENSLIEIAYQRLPLLHAANK